MIHKSKDAAALTVKERPLCFLICCYLLETSISNVHLKKSNCTVDNTEISSWVDLSWQSVSFDLSVFATLFVFPLKQQIWQSQPAQRCYLHPTSLSIQTAAAVSLHIWSGSSLAGCARQDEHSYANGCRSHGVCVTLALKDGTWLPSLFGCHPSTWNAALPVWFRHGRPRIENGFTAISLGLVSDWEKSSFALKILKDFIDIWCCTNPFLLSPKPIIYYFMLLNFQSNTWVWINIPEGTTEPGIILAWLWAKDNWNPRNRQTSWMLMINVYKTILWFKILYSDRFNWEDCPEL